MSATLQDKLVVAISSRALFDFEEENRLFEAGDEQAYKRRQLELVHEPARPGIAFPLVRKLLAFNTPDAARVEVVMLSRNDPASGMRVFASAKAAGMRIERGVFTRGRNPFSCGRWARTSSFQPTRRMCARRCPSAFPPRG